MNLTDAQIAVLAENMYQELELWYPLMRLREEGCNVVVVGPAEQTYASKLGYPVKPDIAIADADPAAFDAVVIPGGFAPENMRRHRAMIDFVRKMHDQGSLDRRGMPRRTRARVGGHRARPRSDLRGAGQGRRDPRRRQVPWTRRSCATAISSARACRATCIFSARRSSRTCAKHRARDQAARRQDAARFRGVYARRGAVARSARHRFRGLHHRRQERSASPVDGPIRSTVLRPARPAVRQARRGRR